MRTGLYLGGAAFWVAAAWFIYSAFQIPMTIQTDGGEVANLQLMHIQSAKLILGVGAGIAAAILTGCGAIIEALRRPD